MARLDQIIRILTVARALAGSRRGVSVKEWAAREGLPWRGVYRDLDVLRAAGFPVETVAGRHRLPRNWAAPHLPGVQEDEVLALYTLRALAGTWRTTAVGKPLERLWMKLTSEARGQGTLVPLTREPWFAVRTPLGIDYRAHDKIIATFERATRDRLAVNSRYRALSTKQPTARIIEPGELYWDPGLESLYVIGWCRLRQDVRVFAIHRFQAATLTDETFTPRAGARSAAALRKAFRVWRSEETQIVRVRFSAEIADEIRERSWGERQVLGQESTDRQGGVVLSLEVAGLAEIARWVLGFGADAEVLAPKELRERVAKAVREAARRYGGKISESFRKGPRRGNNDVTSVDPEKGTRGRTKLSRDDNTSR